MSRDPDSAVDIRVGRDRVRPEKNHPHEVHWGLTGLTQHELRCGTIGKNSTRSRKDAKKIQFQCWVALSEDETIRAFLASLH